MNQMQKELKAVISKYTVGLSNADYTHFMKEIAVVTERHAPKPEAPAPIDKSRPPLQCPNADCNNSGCIPVQYGPDEWQAEQCQFCYDEPNSFFNRSISYFGMVGRTHTKFRFPVTDGKGAKHISRDLQKFRANFLHEELNELVRAMLYLNIVDVADALADIVVIALGTAHFYNIPFDAVFDEVYRSNMDKVRVKDASESKRGSDMNLLKPEGWVGPQLHNILFP